MSRVTGPVTPRSRASPRSVSLVLTTACNLGCAYCYQRRGPPRTMPWAVLRRAVELAAASTDPRPVLVLYGGEPLLARDLVERAVRLARELEDGRRPMSIRLSTNGTLLDLDLVDLLDAYRVEVQLSFDGVPAAQALRSPASFQVVDDLLRQLRVRRPSFLRDRVRAAVTVSSAAVGHLASSIRYLTAFGFGKVAVTPLYSHDPGWTEASTSTLDDQLDRIRRWCAWRLEETGQISFEPLVRRQEWVDPQPWGRDTVCVATDPSRLVVDVDGTLAPCLLAAPSIAPTPPSPLAEAVGRVVRGRVEDPWEEATVGRFEDTCRATGLFHGRDRKHSSWARCRDCEHHDACLPCPLATAWIPGNADPDRVPDHLCAFNRAIASHRSRMPTAATPLERIRGEAPLPRALERLLARTGGELRELPASARQP